MFRILKRRTHVKRVKQSLHVQFSPIPQATKPMTYHLLLFWQTSGDPPSPVQASEMNESQLTFIICLLIELTFPCLASGAHKTDCVECKI